MEQYRHRVRRPAIKVTLNGEQIVDVDQQKMEALRQKPLSGYVCLQNHGGNIEFRELRVREIRGAGMGARKVLGNAFRPEHGSSHTSIE